VSCPCSRSRLRWLRRLCSLVCAIVGCCSAPLRAQESPLHTISEDISAFAYGPNGRIVYSVRHPFSAKLKIGTKSETYDVQREDIWIQDAGGKRRRVIQGDKLTAGNFPFSYLVNSFCFSSDGRMILAELDATFVIDEDGNTRDAQVGLLFDENGKQIKITDQKELLFDAANGGWLAVQVIAHNLARWTGRLGLGTGIVTTKTLRRRLFSLAGRLTRSARRWRLHLPERWPWAVAWSAALARLRAIPLLA